LVITDYGLATSYDYMGDEVDSANGEAKDCYQKGNVDLLYDLGNGAFETFNGEKLKFDTFNMTISDNKLTVKDADEDFGSFPKSSLREYDFTPLCEGVSMNSSGFNFSDNTEKSNIAEPSLSDISGVWDSTDLFDGKQDQSYFVIKGYGVITSYDYMGDEVDSALGEVKDCYHKGNVEFLTDLGDGTFETFNLENGEFDTLNMTISDNKLTIKSAEDDLAPFPKSSLSESDFTPLCESVSINSSGLKESFSQKQASSF